MTATQQRTAVQTIKQCHVEGKRIVLLLLLLPMQVLTLASTRETVVRFLVQLHSTRRPDVRKYVSMHAVKAALSKSYASNENNGLSVGMQRLNVPINAQSMRS